MLKSCVFETSGSTVQSAQVSSETFEVGVNISSPLECGLRSVNPNVIKYGFASFRIRA